MPGKAPSHHKYRRAARNSTHPYAKAGNNEHMADNNEHKAEEETAPKVVKRYPVMDLYRHVDRARLIAQKVLAGEETLHHFEEACLTDVPTGFAKGAEEMRARDIVAGLVPSCVGFLHSAFPITRVFARFVFTTIMTMLRKMGITVTENEFVDKVMDRHERCTALIVLLQQKEGVVDAATGRMKPVGAKERALLDQAFECFAAMAACPIGE